MRTRIFAALAGTAMLTACAESDAGNAATNDQDATAAAEPVGDESLGEYAEGATLVTVEAGDRPPTYDPECAITEQSVAGVPLGPTLGDFAAAFPAGSRLVFRPNAMVDIGQLCLVTGGEPQICADFLSYGITAYSPDIELAQIAVQGGQCRTPEGVGPGSTIEQAAAAYGPPTFSFNYDNEAASSSPSPTRPNLTASAPAPSRPSRCRRKAEPGPMANSPATIAARPPMRTTSSRPRGTIRCRRSGS